MLSPRRSYHLRDGLELTERRNYTSPYEEPTMDFFMAVEEPLVMNFYPQH
jgi:hypothetical protein